MAAYARYRHLAIEDQKPAPSEGELDAVEAELGAALPESFREFLKVAHGGYIEYVVDVPVGENSTEELSFCGIHEVGDGEYGTLQGEMRICREHQGIPEGVLPFARDGGSSMVFLDLTSEGGGRVVAYVQGLPEWTGLRTESAFVELASSFDEYVDMLRIDRGAALDHLKHDATELDHVAATEEWLDIGMPAWRQDSELIEAVAEARKRVG